MAEVGKPSVAVGTTAAQDDDIYTPPDQSLFDFATKHEDRATERHRVEKQQIAHQQHIIVLVLGAIVALGIGGALIAILVNAMGGK